MFANGRCSANSHVHYFLLIFCFFAIAASSLQQEAVLINQQPLQISDQQPDSNAVLPRDFFRELSYFGIALGIFGVLGLAFLIFMCLPSRSQQEAEAANAASETQSTATVRTTSRTTRTHFLTRNLFFSKTS